ncbi:hypothetical protein PHLCEN_2v5001 [Hermanssonia centrifuga]|uniref:Uncharacterized protein n=1 Tax=Hermanssonia centrifuga TaxID=98765 RepID=A0A2R6PC52_9APHY|nr:hypothetical protein PHLCEN_2v5001 [Hermanssonia centrifuga]
MDHINSLVLSAGSIGGPTRRIFAVHETLENIETVFSDRLWPQLASWNERDKHAALIYSE